MGTTWSAHIVDPPADCQTHVEAVLAAVIGEMSNWEAGSDISRFNRSPIGQWTRLPPAMMGVLRAGLDDSYRSRSGVVAEKLLDRPLESFGLSFLANGVQSRPIYVNLIRDIS